MTGLLFVLGGARSGKSRYAQARAEASGLSRLYVATAEALDDEMTERIARHRADRDESWTTIEAPYDLAAVLARETDETRVVLVDCLTLWLTNILIAERAIEEETDGLLAALATAKGPVMLVSNEVGLGLVPETALGRRFRDEAGRLNQKVAALAGEVQFLAAGLNLRLK
jgi:adenosylcobinamide kinase/adenosylcobinamide-phosphate guanylyltransferase